MERLSVVNLYILTLPSILGGGGEEGVTICILSCIFVFCVTSMKPTFHVLDNRLGCCHLCSLLLMYFNVCGM